jgi:hypothetical protein
MAFWTWEFEIGAKDKTSVHWLIEKKFQGNNYYKLIENVLKMPQQYHAVYLKKHHWYWYIY